MAETVAILGASIEPSTIVTKISEKYKNLFDKDFLGLRAKKINAAEIFLKAPTVDQASAFIEVLGGVVVGMKGFFRTEYQVKKIGPPRRFNWDQLLAFTHNLA
ncbi:MAG: hypothetical protein KBD63_02790, partial [Bacteriovoracaceae bacterium]|nr:hypothetical protein [Bacteriovoracaceae bacterium]